MQIHENVAARCVPIHATIASCSPAAHLKRTAPVKTERYPVRTEERFIGPEAAIDGNAAGMIGHHDKGRDILRLNGRAKTCNKYGGRKKYFEIKVFHESTLLQMVSSHSCSV